MTQSSRRKVLKGLAVTFPAAWTAPVVSSVILPAHAQTSPCDGLPRDCYNVQGPEGIVSFFWPGGFGPQLVTGISGPDCNGQPIESQVLVVAPTEAEARILCQSPVEEGQLLESTSCRIWGCIEN